MPTAVNDKWVEWVGQVRPALGVKEIQLFKGGGGVGEAGESGCPTPWGM